MEIALQRHEIDLNLKEKRNNDDIQTFKKNIIQRNREAEAAENARKRLLFINKQSLED